MDKEVPLITRRLKQNTRTAGSNNRLKARISHFVTCPSDASSNKKRISWQRDNLERNSIVKVRACKIFELNRVKS